MLCVCLLSSGRVVTYGGIPGDDILLVDSVGPLVIVVFTGCGMVMEVFFC